MQHTWSVEELQRRAGLPVSALERLAEADAFGSVGLNRREALWAIRGLSDVPLPLFAAAKEEEQRESLLTSPWSTPPPTPTTEATGEPAVVLPPMPAGREVVEDYRTTGLTLRRHPVWFVRDRLRRRGAVTCAELGQARSGRRVAVAGLVLMLQKPGSAKGVMFITLEDETAVANLVVWPSLFEAQRRLVLSAGMLACHGRVQAESGVVHLVAEQLHDLSALLRGVGRQEGAFPLRHGRGDGATHPGAPDPRDGAGLGPGGRPVRDIYVQDLRPGAGIKVPTRDFR